MGCIASTPDQDQTHHQKRLISHETYTKLDLSLRLLASRAADLRRRRHSGEATWLLGGSASSDDAVSSLFSPQLEMRPGSTVNLAAAQAVLMLVFPEDEGEGEEAGEMDTWQRRIGYVERTILPVANQLIRFNYSDILSATKNFHKDGELGRGALSRVYKGKLRTKTLNPNKCVAIKRIESRNQESLNSFCRELAIAGSVRDPHIVPLLGFCVDKEGLFLVYEFVSGGTLDSRLHGNNNEREGKRKVMKWEERYKVAVGIAKAVRYMHFGTNKCIIHRDIKPSNILLSSKKIPKLCDFGMATWTHGPSLPFLCKSVKGTFGYLAPEYFQHGKLSDKTDVYSFGVVLLEIITGRRAIERDRPNGHENLVLWARPILQQGEAGINKIIDPNLNLNTTNQNAELSLLARAASLCLTTNDSHRPDINQILSMLQTQNPNPNDSDWPVLKHSGCLSLTGFGSNYPLEKSDEMKSHLALAMLGVEDNEEDEMYGR
ncbi:hypothetical protein LUZ60_006133 [Juncus effusus]|nr:hypothetical protein LUZ60_006133 [Juncus effusus]